MFPISRLAYGNFVSKFSKNFILFSNVRCLSSNSNGDKRELPKPPENCCMSNCDNCVWIQYGQELIDYLGSEKGGSEKALADLDRLIKDPSLKVFIKMELDQRVRNEQSN